MRLKALKRDIDMTSAPFMKKLLIFAIPLILSGILQLLYNSADLIIVGQFSKDAYNAQAAISSTTSLVHLLVNLFMGLSVGINVACAKALGAKDENKASKVTHTAYLLAIVSGLFVGIVGFILCDDILRLMKSPEEVLPLSALYLKIYFIGSPFNMVYNFGAAILRAKGDTTRPLIFLGISGFINVLLNIFFVLVFKMSVDGVAIATVVSQVISAALVTGALLKDKSSCKLILKKLGFDGKALKEIIKVGLPAGIQSSLFSISNVIIQSSINSFGNVVMAGNGNGQSIEGYICTAVEAIGHAAVAFIAQNCGAKHKANVFQVMRDTFSLMTFTCILMSLAVVTLNRPLLYIFSPDPAVIAAGRIRIFINISFYVFYGWMQIFVSYLRGTGKGTLPMIISLIGVCLFRVFWVYVVFSRVGTIESIYISYPISWLLTAIAQLAAFFITKKQTFKDMQ